MEVLAVIFFVFAGIFVVSGAVAAGSLLRPENWGNSPNDFFNWMDRFLESKGPIATVVSILAAFVASIVAVLVCIAVLL